MLILGFDIGNTRTVLGIYREADITPQKCYSYSTQKDITANMLNSIIDGHLKDFTNNVSNGQVVSGVVLSSVVPEVMEAYSAVVQNLFSLKPVVVNDELDLDIIINYDVPAQLGADRIANAVAVHREYRTDSIIIDLGTAITVCVLFKNGEFDGGLIAPGIGIALDGINEKTSQLARVKFEKPENLVSKNTMDAITSGIFYGWISLIEGIVQRIEMNYGEKFTKILTGGYSEVISNHIGFDHKTDPMLTLKGMKYIYDNNSKE